MISEIQKESKSKMDVTLEHLKKELAGVRTGRASAEILNPIQVDYYGNMTPLSQMATMAVADAQTITVTPFDRSVSKEIEKAIQNSNLGLNPSSDGNMIRVPVPLLTEDRRKDLVKHVKKLGEEGKVAIRNVRRETNEKLKALEKNKDISQDEEKSAQKVVQEGTDQHIKFMDELVEKKEKELMTV